MKKIFFTQDHFFKVFKVTDFFSNYFDNYITLKWSLISKIEITFEISMLPILGMKTYRYKSKRLS